MFLCHSDNFIPFWKGFYLVKLSIYILWTENYLKVRTLFLPWYLTDIYNFGPLVLKKNPLGFGFFPAKCHLVILLCL